MPATRLLRTLLCAALLGLVPVAAAQAQALTTDPTIPTVGEPVTINFNPRATEGLANFDGDLFAHTGLITEQSASDDDWRYVKNDWPEETTGDVQLTRVAPTLYQLRIEDIRAYYSDNTTGAGAVPEDETIQKLAFVFRTDDGSRQSQNLYVELAQGAVAVRVEHPQVDGFDPAFAGADGTLEVRAIASVPGGGTVAALSVLVDGQTVATVEDDEITHTVTLPAPGRYEIGVAGRADDGRADTVRFAAMRNPEVTTEARPDGLRDGITYAEDGTAATLSLYAPGKAFAYVIGSFTDWQVDTDHFMKRDGDYFWTTLDGLTPGQEYPFQYLVDGEIRVADPYSEKVLTGNDHWIPERVYPDLMPYPAGETEHAVGVLMPGGDEYEWQVTDFERPAPRELVIYELLLRDFLEEGDYETLRDTLDYIERLGVNAIELMPVNEFDGNESWGYNPAFHFALDKAYGTERQFKRFVDEAHRRGIAVILDVVYNHATGQSPLIRLWNEGDYGVPTAENPYANVEARHPFNVFNDLDHTHPATQRWLDRANRFWLEEYNVDGYRFDLTKGFMQEGSFYDYNQQRVDLLTRMTDEIWEVDPGAYVIFEHLGRNDEEAVFANYRTDEGLPGIMLWSNLNGPYGEAVMGYHDGGKSDLSWAFWDNRPDWEVPNNVVYMESHDEQWLMYRARTYGAEEGSYDVTDLSTALDRMALAGAFFFPIPGPKMIWQFGEVGYGGGPDECLVNGDYPGECAQGVPGRTAEKPIRWQDYWIDRDAEAEMRRDLYNDWAALIALRNAHPLFTSADTDLDMDTGGALKRITFTHPTLEESAVVVGNFGVADGEVSFTFPETGTWYDFFAGTRFEVTDAARTLTLAPGAFHVYTAMEPAVEASKDRTVDAEQPVGVAQHFGLAAAYPNPFAETATVAFTLEQPGPARLDVFDVLGRRVATLADGPHAAGRHTVRFEAEGLPAGLYLVRLEAAGRTETRRMLHVR